MGTPSTVLSLLIFSSLACLCLSQSFLPREFSIIDENLEHDFAVSEERAVELFQRWKETHRKAYKSDAEAEKRFEHFKRNLKYVMEKKRERRMQGGMKGHYVGLNKFADMSNEEFKRVYGSKIKKPADKVWKRGSNVVEEKKKVDAPSSYDWRDYGIVTPIKDQGECGSCWAFSVTGAIEGINALDTGKLISLSEQELVDCDTTDDGCDGGYMTYAFEWIIKNGGIDTEADYPYTSINGVDGTCNVTKEETKAVSISGYTDVDASDSALLTAVLQQPISVGMDGSALDFQLYDGGIYDGSCSDDPDDIDHAVLIVGYGSEGGEDYWIVKNSWGPDWGIEGYFLIRRNTDLPYGECAINAMASYPTQSSSSSRKMGKHRRNRSAASLLRLNN